MSSTENQARGVQVVAILPVLGQPRYAKRLDNLMARGFEVRVLAFARDYHRGRLPSCPTTIVGSAVRGRYWSRLLSIAKAVRSVRRETASADLVYTFGPDMALLGLLARGLRRLPVVLEIGDILPIQTRRGFGGRLFRMIDRAITRRCAMIVSTTPRFVSEYYRKWLGASTPALILENKVESDFAREIRMGLPGAEPRGGGRRIRIGWFGSIRCKWALQVLSSLAKRYPDRFEVLLAGFTWDWLRLEDYTDGAPNIEFIGQYRSPADLPRLYGDIDVTWGCYPPILPDDWNHKWARPNRFYESCTFKVPLISREGSCDAVDVARYGIGLVLSEDDPEKAADFIAANIDRARVDAWRSAFDSVPDSCFMYTTEFDELADAIRAIASGMQPSPSPSAL
jgi:succinoglycan biosynthesis protein ExoL